MTLNPTIRHIRNILHSADQILGLAALFGLPAALGAKPLVEAAEHIAQNLLASSQAGHVTLSADDKTALAAIGTEIAGKLKALH